MAAKPLKTAIKKKAQTATKKKARKPLTAVRTNKTSAKTTRENSKKPEPKGKPFSLKKKREVACEVIERLRAIEPDPKCELYFETSFQLLVSVVLSAQTTDKMVNRCMEPIYKNGFTPETPLAWGQEKLLSAIRTIGLAPTKSKNIMKLSEMVINDFNSEVPDNRQDLESLPGVGKKTASVILGEIFRHPTLAVDTHVYRVTRRLGLQYEKNAETAEGKLLEIIPSCALPAAHHWFILQGRYTCKAISPKCDICVLQDICPSY